LIDVDACPKLDKENAYKRVRRLKVPVIPVANGSLHVPRSDRVPWS